MRALLTVIALYLHYAYAARHPSWLSHKSRHRPMRVTPTLLRDFETVPIPKGVLVKTNPTAATTTNSQHSTLSLLAGSISDLGISSAIKYWWPFSNCCWWPEVRKDWRTLTQRQQASYIAAELCLRKRPSRLTPLNISLPTTLNDDYASAHVQGSYAPDAIHYTAAFLPWHRLLLQTHATDLRLCGYLGPIPYWDWASDADASDVPGAAIFDANAFGGNGPTDGAFVDQIVNIIDLGGQVGISPHTIKRHFALNDMLARNYNTTSMSYISSVGDYFNFLLALESIAHDSVHYALGGIGGDLDTMASPVDPIFFLLHGNVDRVWYNWQRNHPTAVQFQGPRSLYNFSTWDASTDDALNMYGLTLGNVKVSDVLSTKGGYLCYKYKN